MKAKSNSKVNVILIVVTVVCLILAAPYIYLSNNGKAVSEETALRPLEETIDDLVYINNDKVALSSDLKGDTPTAAAVREAFSSINSYRVREGLPSLAWSDELEQAAGTRAEEISERLHFSHERPDGSEFYTVLIQKVYGEVIAKGYRSGLEATEVWMKSEANRQVLLNEDFKTIGIYVYYEENGNWYWAAELGV